MYKPYDYYDQQDQQSEMLIEEIDPQYQPNQQQIKIYAVATLGMNLPQDLQFLYLARQALKAPLPQNWNAFQNRQGQVYYKHRITQQVTNDHPIDIEYRRRYLQQKQKLARRGLKSMSSKGSGIGVSKLKLFGNIARQEELNSKEIFMNESGLKQQQISEKYVIQFENFIKQCDLRYNEFRINQQNWLKQKQKQIGNQHENELKRIKRQQNTINSFQQRLLNEKNRLKKQLQTQCQNQYKQNVKKIQQQMKRNLKTFQKNMIDQYKLKIKLIQQKGQTKIEAKSNQIQKIFQKIQKLKAQYQIQAGNEQKKAQLKYKQSKQLCDKQFKQRLNQNLKNIQRQKDERVKLKQKQLEGEYQRIRKLLGNSNEDILQDFLRKKSRLIGISNKKLQTQKLRGIQMIQKQIEYMWQRQRLIKHKQLNDRFNEEYKNKVRQEQQKNKIRLREDIQQMQSRVQKCQAEIYEINKQKITNYELRKNKSLLQKRQKFIKQIENKKNDNQNTHKLLDVQARQFDIANKKRQITSFKNKIKSIQFQIYKFKFDRQLINQQQITTFLKNHLQPKVSNSYIIKLNTLQNTYSNDMNILNQIQLFLSEHYISKAQYKPNSIQAKLQQDMKLMKQNKQLINRLQQLVNNKQQGQLQQLMINYKIPSLRNEFKSLQLQSQNKKKKGSKYTRSLTSGRVQQMFVEHSQYLNKLKNELNTKLSQIKGMNLIHQIF